MLWQRGEAINAADRDALGIVLGAMSHRGGASRRIGYYWLGTH